MFFLWPNVCSALSRKNLKSVAQFGCPSTDLKAVKAAKRLRAFLQIEEGIVSNLTITIFIFHMFVTIVFGTLFRSTLLFGVLHSTSMLSLQGLKRLTFTGVEWLHLRLLLQDEGVVFEWVTIVCMHTVSWCSW
jgi:hypothetical protein